MRGAKLPLSLSVINRTVARAIDESLYKSLTTKEPPEYLQIILPRLSRN